MDKEPSALDILKAQDDLLQQLVEKVEQVGELITELRQTNVSLRRLLGGG